MAHGEQEVTHLVSAIDDKVTMIAADLLHEGKHAHRPRQPSKRLLFHAADVKGFKDQRPGAASSTS